MGGEVGVVEFMLLQYGWVTFGVGESLLAVADVLWAEGGLVDEEKFVSYASLSGVDGFVVCMEADVRVSTYATTVLKVWSEHEYKVGRNGFDLEMSGADFGGFPTNSWADTGVSVGFGGSWRRREAVHHGPVPLVEGGPGRHLGKFTVIV